MTFFKYVFAMVQSSQGEILRPPGHKIYVEYLFYRFKSPLKVDERDLEASCVRIINLRPLIEEGLEVVLNMPIAVHRSLIPR